MKLYLNINLKTFNFIQIEEFLIDNCKEIKFLLICTAKSEKNDQFSHEIRFHPSLTVLTHRVFIIWRDISRWNLSIKKKKKRILFSIFEVY